MHQDSSESLLIYEIGRMSWRGDVSMKMNEKFFLTAQWRPAVRKCSEAGKLDLAI